MLSISPDVEDPSTRAITFDELRAAYAEQVRGLVDGGADLLLVETIFDRLNAKAAIVAIEDVAEETGVRLPLMISVTITDRSGRTLAGQTIEAFWITVAHARPFSVGVNCALGAAEMRPYLADLSRVASCWTSCYPNAGLPNAFGEYDEGPDETAGELREFAVERPGQHRRRLLRHDPGPHPRHRRARPPARRRARSRVQEPLTRLAGLEPLVLRPDTNFLMIGERTNVTGSQRFAELILAGDFGDGPRGGRRAGAQRRQHHRREHGRGHARLRGGHDHVPQPGRHRAGHRQGPDHGRQLEVVGHRGGPALRAGQAGRQLDQPEGGRGGLPRQGAASRAATARRWS